MRCATRPAVESLSAREEFIADTAAVVVRLRDAGFDMRTWRDQVRFDASVSSSGIHRAAAGKPDDVVGIVGAAVADSAPVVARLADVFARADSDHVLRSSR